MDSSNLKVVGLSNSKSVKKTNWKIVSAIIGIVVLSIGVVAGIILVRQQQNISEKASVPQCSVAGTEQCPVAGAENHLWNCHPAEADGSPKDSLCNLQMKGRIEFCKDRNYCCNGASWTSNMTACPSSPTPTATAHATATPTAAPSRCNSSCNTNVDCPDGLICATDSKLRDKFCRKLACVNDSDCICSASATPIATSSPRVTSTPITVSCNQSCNLTTNPQTVCSSGLACYDNNNLKGNNGLCRNVNCSSRTDCRCLTQTATPTPNNEPNSCGGTCGSNSNCASGLFCYRGLCKNPDCSSVSNCNCSGASSSPTSAPIPVTGVEWPTILGSGFGIMMILISLGLAL